MSDLISRADAIKAIEELPNAYNGWSDTYDKACIIGVLEEVPTAGQNCVLCEYYTEIETDDGIKGKCTRRTGSDLISKEDVKWQIQEWINELNEVVDMLDSIPSADRPTGEWVDECTCSICHWMHEDNNGFALITKYNYCPNCGCLMKKGD